MRALEIREPFGVDALTCVDRPVPDPRAGEVLIKTRALALNYRDLLVVDGVNRWRSGAPTFYPRWIDGGPAPEKMSGALGGAAADGLFAEYVVGHESSVVRVPNALSDVEAATLPCAGVTAWHGVADLSFRANRRGIAIVPAEGPGPSAAANG